MSVNKIQRQNPKQIPLEPSSKQKNRIPVPIAPDGNLFLIG